MLLLVVIDIRLRKLWKSEIPRTPENAKHFHEELPLLYGIGKSDKTLTMLERSSAPTP